MKKLMFSCQHNIWPCMLCDDGIGDVEETIKCHYTINRSPYSSLHHQSQASKPIASNVFNEELPMSRRPTTEASEVRLL